MLCVDWDLEAPGLHHYFRQGSGQDLGACRGVVELVREFNAGSSPDWASAAVPIEMMPCSGALSLIPAGKLDSGYPERLQAINWGRLYREKNFGLYVEDLRASWNQRYDFVLVDSRTGVTDIGGICTAQLPDLLALCFVANNQSLSGAIDVARRAAVARNGLPYDRYRALALPLLSRLDSREEYALAEHWRTTVAAAVQEFYDQWVPVGIQALQLIERTTIPYVPVWSFGEEVPAARERASNPELISHAFETIAALIARHLNDAGDLVYSRDRYVQEARKGHRHVKSDAVARECPYPGLASSTREQARWFFGRDGLTAELIARLDARLRTGGMQMVVAPSGAGKSSLLHAGLLASLGNGAVPGSSRWPTIVVTPTAHPLATLAAQVAALTGADSATLAEELAAGAQGTGAVPHEALRRCLSGKDFAARVVVVVDQFEELFTLCTDDQQRSTFIELLAQLASSRSDAEGQPSVGLVVVGVRADFFVDCTHYPQLRAALADNPLVVGPMSDTELRTAVLYPAQEAGLNVEPGLVELLLRDLGDSPTMTGEDGMTSYEAGRLPWLAHALRATWQQQRGDTLTVDAYRSTGGIHRAVATMAECIFTALDPTGQHAARTLFLRLIKIWDGTKTTRRCLTRADLLQGLDPDRVSPVVEAFTQGRLLTQDQDTVEITHDALLRSWPQLREWIDTDLAGNLIRQELENAAASWNRDRRDVAGLYRGERLKAARTWVTARSVEDDLSPGAAQFLDASLALEYRARFRRTVLVPVLLVLALVVSGTAIVAFHQRLVAQRERDIAIANQITVQADQLRNTDVSLAAQLDLTTYRLRPASELYTALVNLGNAVLATPLTGHTGEPPWVR